MEVKLTITIIGEDEQPATRGAFWNTIIKRASQKINKDTVKNKDKLELQFYKELPKRLISMIIVNENKGTTSDSTQRKNTLKVTLSSINYSHMEIGVNIFTTNNLNLNSDDICNLIAINAPEIISDLLYGSPIAITVGSREGKLKLSKLESKEKSIFHWTYKRIILALLLVIILLGLLPFYMLHIIDKQMYNIKYQEPVSTNDQIENIRKQNSKWEKTITDDGDKKAKSSEVKNNFKSQHVVTGQTPSTTNTSSESKAFLQVGDFTIFSSKAEFNSSDVLKDIIKSTATAPFDQANSILTAIGTALDNVKKFAHAADAVHDTIYKYFPKNGNQSDILPVGTLLDQQVRFSFDSYKLELTPDLKDSLKILSKEVREENIAILIEGHTDSVGSISYNRQLSTKRAKAVRDYLLTQNVAPKQLKIIGYGEEYLWVPYKPTSEKNRRVRIMQCIIGNVNRCAE